MKKKILQIVSYILVATAASVLTLSISQLNAPPSAGMGGQLSKLDQLEMFILNRFIGEADQTVLEDAAASGMIASLGDRWSYYISADQWESYNEQKNNAYVGIGVTITQPEDKSGLEIIKVTEGGPAGDAGIQAGDVIVAVEKTAIAGMDTDTVKEMIRGEEGSSVSLTILRGAEEIEFTVLRKQILTPVATGKMLDGKIGLVTIANFNSNCSAQAIAAIQELVGQGAEKLIFDVRFNPGGYASELVALLDYLLPEGDLFRTVDYAGRESVDRSDAECLKMPMAVLVNGDSYSAAEFFAAALAEYDWAEVVGEQTCGKGYFQNTFQLVDGSAVALSIGKYFTPKGVSLADAGGLVPDVPVAVDEETAYYIYAGTLDPMEDPQILAAIEALKES